MCCAAAAGACSAAVFGPTTVLPGETAALQTFNLWLAEGDAWQAVLLGRPFLRHRLAGGPWHAAGAAATGAAGPGQVVQWEIGVHPAWAAPGLYSCEGEFQLLGASGLVWYRSEELNVLPLNSAEFTAQARDGLAVLHPGQWHVLAEPVEIRWRGQVVPLEPSHSGTVGMLAAGVGEGGAFWAPGSLSLEAGASAPVTLRLQGPAPAGMLVITLPPELVLQGRWQVSMGQVTQRSNGTWQLEIPPLGLGDVVEITGRVAALLPHVDGKAAISALWHGVYTELPVHIGRGWFTRAPRLELTALSQSEPAREVEFILAQGTRLKTDSHGRAGAELKPGLQPIFPASNPDLPVWVNALPELPLAVEVELTEPAREFLGVLGSLVLREGGQGYASLHGPGFSAGFADGESRAELAVGPWQGEWRRGEWALRWTGPLETYSAGKWLWVGRDASLRGVYRSPSVRLGIDILGEDMPQVHVHLYEGKLAASLSQNGVTTSCFAGPFTMGVDWGKSLAWVTLRPERLRLAVSPMGWSLQRHAGQDRFRLAGDFRGQVSVDLARENVSLLIKSQRDGVQWGMTAAWGDLVGTLQVVESHYVLELRRGLMRQLTEKLVVFAHASVQLHPRGISHHWEAGLQVSPLPWLAGTVSYCRREGLAWQLGLSLAI